MNEILPPNQEAYGGGVSPGRIWSAVVSAALDLWPADSIAPSGLEVVGDW
jgi:hypothetical protein